MSNALKFVASCRLPTEWGEFTMYGFEEEGGQEHVALTMGDVSDGLPVLSRIHSECLTGDTFGSLRCDCGQQLAAAMTQIEKEGTWSLVILRLMPAVLMRWAMASSRPYTPLGILTSSRLR